MVRASSWLPIALVVACTSPPPPRPPPTAPEPPPPPVNAPIEEPTVATAGGSCETRFETKLGPALPGALALAVGSRGGLALWRSAEGAVVQPLRSDGHPTGERREVVLPHRVVALVPSSTGFLLVAQGRLELLAVALDGEGGEGPRAAVELVAEPVVATMGPHEGHLGLITAGGYWVDVHHDGDRVTIDHHATALSEGVLPVQGEGPPAVLTGEGRTLDRLVTAQGSRSLRLDPEVLEHTGMVIDARLQARYGPDGQIHVAWMGWLARADHVGYAVLDGARLRFLGTQPFADGGLREPFEDNLVAWVHEGVLYRESWLTGAVGEGVSLGETDSAVVGWTGQALAVVHRHEGWAQLRLLACP